MAVHTMFRKFRGKPFTMIALFGGIMLGAILSAGFPSTSSAQYWDYDFYHGTYGPYGHGWYYDYYDVPRLRDTEGWGWKSDWELKQDVKSELAWSPFVDADDIDVSVRNGEVTLKGTVEGQDEIQDAIENAYEAGAKKCISKLKAQV
jgi:hypothetical protein